MRARNAPRLRRGTWISSYRVERLLHSGRHSSVYSLREGPRDGVVAKVFSLRVRDQTVVDRVRRLFASEARAAELRHPHVIPVHEVGEQDGLLFLIMDHALEGDLRSAVGSAGALGLLDAVGTVRQVASALDRVHAAGFVHRDVNPSNVLLSGSTCYLADFGLSQPLGDPSGGGVVGAAPGTAGWMSPEQIRIEVLTPASDQYLLGLVAHFCLAGRDLFDELPLPERQVAHLSAPPPAPSGWNTDVPPAVAEVVRVALAKDPRRRFPDCTAFAEALAAACSPAPGRGWSPPPA